MPTIAYKSQRFHDTTQEVIAKANAIMQQYVERGMKLTLRQLYYRFIALDAFPESWADEKTGSKNNERSYDRLGDAISNARLCGLLDWDAIHDRTRGLRAVSHWTDPSSIIRSAAASFALDKWVDQEYRVEVWIEKDALVGVIEDVCSDLDTAFLSCRGYVSQSEAWGSAMRLVEYRQQGQVPIILHLGDHDPSGLDMTRDLQDRLTLFMEHHGVEVAEIKRIALNIDQVRTYNPPPAPAKVTDSRADEYIKLYGKDCWELDALEPQVLIDLVRKSILDYQDVDKFRAMTSKQEKMRRHLTRCSKYWQDVARFVDQKHKDEDSPR